jgi:phosphorylcholine metabolism protein LicD
LGQASLPRAEKKDDGKAAAEEKPWWVKKSEAKKKRKAELEAEKQQQQQEQDARAAKQSKTEAAKEKPAVKTMKDITWNESDTRFVLYVNMFAIFVVHKVSPNRP